MQDDLRCGGGDPFGCGMCTPNGSTARCQLHWATLSIWRPGGGGQADRLVRSTLSHWRRHHGAIHETQPQKKVARTAGFEPALPKEMPSTAQCVAGHRVNRSATSAASEHGATELHYLSVYVYIYSIKRMPPAHRPLACDYATLPFSYRGPKLWGPGHPPFLPPLAPPSPRGGGGDPAAPGVPQGPPAAARSGRHPHC